MFLLKMLDDYFEKTKGYYPFFKICPFFLREHYLKKRFYNTCHYVPDFKNPKTYNEKIWYLLRNEKLHLKTYLADKLNLKEYVIKNFGPEFVPETYVISNKLENICFANIPDKFALKANHGWGFILLCNNKNKFLKNIVQVNKKTNFWLKTNYYYYSLEPQYKNIKPRLYIEELTVDELSQSSLKHDIMFHCFNGEPLYIETSIYKNNQKYIFYHDIEWNNMPWGYKETNDIYSNKSLYFTEMYNIAKIISAEFKYIRVDFREKIKNGKTDGFIIGEITFSPWSGMLDFKPFEYDLKLGELIKI